MLRTPGGLVFAPTRDGEVLTPEQFQGLSEEERKQIESQMEELQNELQKLLRQVPEIQREIRERMRELNQGFIDFAVGGLIRDLQQKYSDNQKISDYLNNVKEDVTENADELLPKEEEATSSNPILTLISRAQSSTPGILNRYKVNLLVDHSEMKGAPVVFEDNPTYQNLIGEVEHIAQMGALVTDFTLIKTGSLHNANGGFLIIDARKLLSQPYAWEGLKRALQSGEIKIESLGQMLSVITTVTLEPQPIPLNIKIALFGDRLLYYLLLQYDPDFPELFKVQADFEEQMPRDDGNQGLYARLLAGMVRRNRLRPFDRNAVSRVIEYSSRLVEDSQRLTLHLETISDLLQEADYYAGTRDQQVVGREDVQKAIDARVYRADRLREREQETILRNIWLIDTQGEKVGQVNGLSVITLGNYSFGRPSRITARVWIGKGDLVDIDRQVDLSGPIHSKGVLILSGFLGARYAREKPLSLSASLAFEQSYSGIEGDSASSAELYALLSAIAEVPIKQNYAVTGAINQYGQVQAIGGVNEKIEGFFDICKARGLTGDQGVLIPSANIVHLMLRQDVIDAVNQGKFKIYPVDHIDQGIEILTGIPAGEPNKDGQYPEDTINGKVQVRLEALAEKREEFRKGEEAEEEEKEEEKEPAKASNPKEGE
jgi:lon-related putative ATP-dependent protease